MPIYDDKGKEESNALLNLGDRFIHESTFIHVTASIGKGTKIWHFCHVCKDATIGRNCSIGQNCYIGPGVEIGDGVKIQNNVSIYEGITIDDGVFIGPSVVFTNVLVPRSVFRAKGYLKTNVGTGSTIGANATIVCGNNVGDFAFVGAGSVVTKHVPEKALVYGNPARTHGAMTVVGIDKGKGKAK
jgi:UDP-2-acetamido-3-amino-2,3-dideoxy-glucuronate N-acetyltransferase